ncbi:hypothetical protein Metbo_1135 [Methanobacterium lacus]|uniref:Uncharacterized protein n=1 Tax=Methanobacterium lacus (strain AL-21) TaxID=877455 RepID=F0T5Y6_METLA|nr:hypothetical protein [Methanobacterium lacus]ADZ09379.1 hypothetical protein Metbo_1135 [Methanobacterium lacus]
MDRIGEQSRLSELPKPKYKTKPPTLLLNWDQTRPDLKKFIYLHIIRAAGEYQDPHMKLTASKLVESMASNTGIIKRQLNLYIENLLFYGYLLKPYLNDKIIVSDKLYNDLRNLDRIPEEHL